MHASSNEKANYQCVDSLIFKHGINGFISDYNKQSFVPQFCKYFSKTKAFLTLKKFFNLAEDDKSVTISKRCLNTPTDRKLNIRKNNQLVLLNRGGVGGSTNPHIKYIIREDDRSITTEGTCIFQDTDSMIYICAPESLPNIKSNSDTITDTDSLPGESIDHGLQCNDHTDSDIFLSNNEYNFETEVHLLKFLDEWIPPENAVNGMNSAYHTNLLDSNDNFIYPNKYKEFKDIQIMTNKEIKHQEVQTSSVCYLSYSNNGTSQTEKKVFDPLNFDKYFEIYAISEKTVFSSGDTKKTKDDKLNLLTKDNLVNCPKDVSDLNSQDPNQGNHLKTINNAVSKQDQVFAPPSLSHQHDLCRLPNDDLSCGITSASKKCFESIPERMNDSYFNNICHGFKRNRSHFHLTYDSSASREEIKDIHKAAIQKFRKSMLKRRFPPQNLDIYESYGQNQNCSTDQVHQQLYDVIHEYVPLPRMEDQRLTLKDSTYLGETDKFTQTNQHYDMKKPNNTLDTELCINIENASDLSIKRRTDLIPKKELSSNATDVLPCNHKKNCTSKKFLHKHVEDESLMDSDISVKNNYVVNKNLVDNSEIKYKVANRNSDNLAIPISSPTAIKYDNTSSLCGNIEFSINLTRDQPIIKTETNSNNGNGNKIHKFVDSIFREFTEGYSTQLPPPTTVSSIQFKENSEDKSNDDSVLLARSQSFGPESNLILLDSGEPAVLFNACGFPLTDLKGRKLKNIFETELLPVRNMEELVSSQLKVYDCYNVSINHKDFNPVKSINLVKDKIQVLGKNNVPTRLYNSWGYPLNDEDGILLYDSRGNLMVTLDSSGSPLCCINSGPIYLQDGTFWNKVRDCYFIFHNDNRITTLNPLDNNTYCFNRSLDGSIDHSYQLPFNEETNNLKLEQSNQNLSNDDKFKFASASHSNDLDSFTNLGVAEQSSSTFEDTFFEIMDELESSLKVSDYHASVIAKFE